MTHPILITGANGLLGRALIGRLAASRDVCALVRRKPETPLPGNVSLILHDLRQSLDFSLEPVPDTIVHLAQSPCYRDFPDGALDVFEVNVGSTQRLLDWAHQHGVKRFIYASSGGVYDTGPKAFEEDHPLGPNISHNHYIVSKRCGEFLAECYRGIMTIIVLRFFFVYGPGQRHTMLIRRLLDNVLNGRPIKLQGHDGMRLNPIYADDAAAAVESALVLDGSETINVAGSQVLTMRRIGELIGEETGHLPRFEIEPNAYPKDLVGSTLKMTALLGSSRIGMAEGLRRMHAVYEADLTRPDAR